MQNPEVTIKQIADECGVSKSTAVRRFKELGLPVASVGAKGTVYLGQDAASALAHALTRGRIAEPVAIEDDAVEEDEPQAPIEGSSLDAVIEAWRGQVATLREANGLLRSQIESLNQSIVAERQSHEQTVALLSAQIDRLTEQVASVQKEKDRMQDELALSRALEGFHFPWQRERIVSRYLLPQAGNKAAPEPLYETPE